MSEIDQAMREMERAKARQLDITRGWILLFTLAATVGLWWVIYNQLQLDFYLSWMLGFAAAYILSRIISFFVRMQIGKRHARKLSQLEWEHEMNTFDNGNGC
jgi:hypothetical protein